jgi:hypothetical protein
MCAGPAPPLPVEFSMVRVPSAAMEKAVARPDPVSLFTNRNFPEGCTAR